MEIEQAEKEMLVVFSGAGVSAESGLRTFRDSNGLWENFRIEDIASPEGWTTNPDRVLEFYNKRRRQAAQAEPNKAHRAIARLEEKFDVVIVTQNVDDLHERAGSSNVIHVHGQLNKARSTGDNSLVYDIGDKDILPGDLCDSGYQLRPHIVWFGEDIQHYQESRDRIKEAHKVLVVGTSLTVYPAAAILKKARYRAEKVIVALEIDKKPYGYDFFRGKATELVPHIVETWLLGRPIATYKM